jgi:hypothetical protein
LQRAQPLQAVDILLVEDLLPDDVGVPAVLGEFAQHIDGMSEAFQDRRPRANYQAQSALMQTGRVSGNGCR